MLIYLAALVALVFYLWRHRSDPLGASLSFLWIILIFHGPMLYFYTQIWSGEFNFGQLPYLISGIATDEIVGEVYLAFALCVACVILGIYFYNFFNGQSNRPGDVKGFNPTPPFLWS